MVVRLCTLLLTVSVIVLTHTSSAFADDAGLLVVAARRATQLGQHDFATQALRQAYDIKPADELLRSIGMSYRQQFLRSQRHYDLEQAIAYLRNHVERTGNARSAATLRELEAVELGAPAPDAWEQAAAAENAATRVAILSPVLDAKVRIDGGRAKALPLFVEVAPGTHRLVVISPGHRTVKRKFTAGRGSILALDVKLAPLPATLEIAGPSGAAVHIDGEFRGVLPFDDGIEVEPGTRSLLVTDTGYHTFRRTVTLGRGSKQKIEVELEVTSQRIVASLLLGVGSASLAAGVVFGVFSVVEHRASRDLVQRIDGPLNPELQAEYDGYLARRDDFRVGSGITGGLGLGLFLLGGALFILDDPDEPELSVGITPSLGPGQFGGAISVGF